MVRLTQFSLRSLIGVVLKLLSSLRPVTLKNLIRHFISWLTAKCFFAESCQRHYKRKDRLYDTISTNHQTRSRVQNGQKTCLSDCSGSPSTSSNMCSSQLPASNEPELARGNTSPSIQTAASNIPVIENIPLNQIVVSPPSNVGDNPVAGILFAS